jgi:cytoskeletal protein CcmA (bactofilin family)
MPNDPPIGTLRSVDIGPHRGLYRYDDGAQFADLDYHTAFRTDGDMEIGGALVLTDITIGGFVIVESTSPEVTLKETDAAADNKLWGMLAEGEEYRIRAINDAVSSSQDAIKITRTGITIDEVYIGPGPDLTVDVGAGEVEVAGDLSVVGDTYPSGGDSNLYFTRASGGVLEYHGINASWAHKFRTDAGSPGCTALFDGGAGGGFHYMYANGNFRCTGVLDIDGAGTSDLVGSIDLGSYSTAGDHSLNVRGSGATLNRPNVRVTKTSALYGGSLMFETSTDVISLRRHNASDVGSSVIQWTRSADGVTFAGDIDVNGTGISSFGGDVQVDGELDIDGTGLSTFAGSIDMAGTIRSTDGDIPTSGVGVHMQYIYGAGEIKAYDYDLSTFKQLNLYGSNFSIDGNGDMQLDGELDVDGTGWNLFAGGIDAACTMRTTGYLAVTSGAGLELLYLSGVAYVQAYDRDSPSYKPIVVAGSNAVLNSSGDLQLDGEIQCDGTGTSAFAGLIEVDKIDVETYFKFPYSDNNVSDPPTEAELNTAFGTPGSGDEGQAGILNDNDAGTDVYLCFAINSDWFYIKGTKA